jgi:hypothetical protein
VATAADLFNPIFRGFLSASRPRLGIYIPYERVNTKLLLEGVKAVGCVPEDCVLFVDFTGAPFALDGVAGSVAGLFDELGNAARWIRIVFQGSAFPTTNPAESGGQYLVARNEWKIFLAALRECSIPPELIGFGDFGADCGEIKFPRKSGGVVPIRHLRYTAATSIIVIRGRATGEQGDAMKDVCQRALACGQYAGQRFSYADDQIWRVAHGQSTGGTPSMWREWNMAHHMTRVVRDFGAMVGITFADGPASPLVEQASLFPE